MIGQIDIEKTLQLQPNKECLFVSLATVLNHVVDAVNTIQKEREAERFEIQEWIGILEAVRKSVNIHEKQIDELQMKVEPEKCEIPTDNSEKANCQENVQDKFAEQRKWRHKLCWFWNDGRADYIGILYEIHDLDEIPFENDLGEKYQHCRPVKPDDPIIYKGEKCETPAENVQPDYVTTSYMTDGHTKEYYGQNGASIVTDHPLPAGYVITIRESETKGGDNE